MGAACYLVAKQQAEAVHHVTTEDKTQQKWHCGSGKKRRKYCMVAGKIASS